MILRTLQPLLILFLLGLITNAADKPNLVLMIADDCTYLDMEIYGGQAATPNLVKLASEGMQFSRCFQTAPMCSPTRHNIYTGLYPVRSGAWPNHTRVYDGTKSIGHFLKDAGYRVALSGKTHVSPRESFPFEYDGEFKSKNPAAEDPYPTLRKLIRESKKKAAPFCIFACSNEPHSPWTKGDASAYKPDELKLPPSWVDTPETRKSYANYLAEITYYDAQCGALLKLLDQEGETDNTLVVVVSEQGSSFPFAKWTCFELGLSSGMVARWPGKIAAGSKSEALVEYCDLTPTFIDAAGAGTAETAKLDGKSFLPVLLGTATEHKDTTFGLHTTRGIINGSEHFGIRSAGNKTHRYIRNLHPEIQFTNAATKSAVWKSWQKKAASGDAHAEAMLAKYSRRPAEELYDVRADPHCLNNLIDQPELASVKDALSDKLDAWMKQQGDQGRETEALAKTRQGKRGKSPPKGKGGNKKNRNKQAESAK